MKKAIVVLTVLLLASKAWAFPYDVETQIKQDAAADFPGNYQMQVFAVQQQEKSYEQLQNFQADVPSDVLAQILDKASKDFPGNYQMQLFETRQQVKAYQQLNGGGQ
jgi:peptidoglycan hydrolase CwlO-like protein